MKSEDEALQAAIQEISTLGDHGRLVFKKKIYKNLTVFPDVIRKTDGLKRLELEETKISDLSVLSGLDDLELLELTACPVVDLSPLSKLKNLKRIYLEDTQVLDISPLANLTELRELRLDGTDVVDIAPLKRLSNLIYLGLARTGITDLSDVSGLSGLRELNLNGSRISTLSTIANFPNLTILQLSGTRIKDFRALRELHELKQLDLSQTSFSDLEIIRSKSRLELLNIDDTPVSSLGVLGELANPSYPLGQGRIFFQNCTASTEDIEISAISKIEDHSVRSTMIYNYLNRPLSDETSPLETNNHSEEPEPAIPDGGFAPLLTEIIDGRLVRRSGPPPTLDSSSSEELALKAWEAISDFKSSFESTLNLSNYRPLYSALNALGRAMSDSYEHTNEIALGLCSQRLSSLSQDSEFTATLPDGVHSELVTFAAFLGAYSLRFPNWVSYMSEMNTSETDGLQVLAGLNDFREIRDCLKSAQNVDDEVAHEYSDSVELIIDGKAGDLATNALLSSTRELLITLAEHSLLCWRFNRDRIHDHISKIGDSLSSEGRELGKIAPTEIRKKTYWAAVGIVGDVIVLKGATLSALAARFPDQFGWLMGVLKFFGM